MAGCLFCIHCEEKIDLEASRCFGLMSGASETFPGEPFDGLAGRRVVRDWRRKEACRSRSFIVGAFGCF